MHSNGCNKIMTKYLNYPEYINKAMRQVIKNSLKCIEKYGIKKPHCILITFNTTNKDVVISDRLREKYPKHLKIVLQHQFFDFEVKNNFFQVKLSFNNLMESIKVSFESITCFFDPSVNFCLYFDELKEKNINKKIEPKKNNQKDNIIMLDEFRQNYKKDD